MPQNSETRIRKNNTLEEFRQKSNDISLDLGDSKLIDSRILDKTLTFTASADQAFYESGTMRYEYKSDETLDDTTHQISNPVGRVRVFNGSTEYTPALSGSNTYKTPLYVANIALTGSPTLTEFVENTVVYQASSAQTDLSASAVTFQGKILSSSVADGIRLKTDSGTYNANAALRVHPGTSGRSVSTNTITSSQHTAKTTIDGTFGRLIQINAGNVNSGDVIKIVSHSLVDAINEVQDDIGDITSLGTNTSADIVSSINELETAVRGGTSQLVQSFLTTSSTNLLGAINELDAEIGNVGNIDAEAGYSATTVVGGITELQDHLGTKANLTTTAKGDLVLAINEVDANADASLKKIDSGTQTLNTGLLFTNGNTITIPTGATLDIRQGELLVGGGTGTSVSFNTAFLNLSANINRRGISWERSGVQDIELVFDQTQVSASKGHRAFRIKGLNESGNAISDSGNVNHVYQDLVTFYNAKDLITSNTETGISVNWDSDNGNFDFALTADPTVTFSGGDVTGNFTLTNLTDANNVALTIGSGVVENSMLAGSITAAKLAGSIPNNKLSNSSITVSDGSNTSPIALGGTLTVQGTSGEVEVAESAGTVTVGLPSDVVIGNDLTITGDLIVQGDTTTLNTSTLQVEDTLVLMGASGTLPTTGGFGLETRLFSGRANQTIDNRTWSNTGQHPNAASNVTGSHSIVFNFGYDPGGGAPKGRWEMDGSPLLSSATAGSPQIEGQSFATGDNLVFSAGAGLSESVSLSSGTHTVTFTNTDLGSAQNIFKNIALQTHDGTAITTHSADSNNDTLTIKPVNVDSVEGIVITNAGADTIGIQHANTSSQASADNSGNTFVQDITLDTYGHITNINSVAVANLDNYQHWSIDADSGSSEQITSTETVQFIGGTGLTTSRSGNNITTTLDNTAVTAGSYGGSLKLNSFTVDAQGRLTAAADGLTLSAGTRIAISGSGVISTSADNYDHFGVSVGGNKSTSGAVGDINSNDTLTFDGGTGIQLAHNGNTITITNTSTNTDTNTIVQFTADSGGTTSYSGNGNVGPLDIQGGTGITTSLSGNTININNDSPDRTVSLTGSGATSVSGTYPNFTISSTDNNTTYSAGEGLQLSGTTFSMDGAYNGTFTVSGEIRATGDIIAFQSSDERLKDNKLVIENSLDKVGQIKGYEFDWNDKQDSYEGHDIGIIAQEVEKVVPEIVETREDGYKAVKYEKLVPILINAINELKAEIEELKSINKKV